MGKERISPDSKIGLATPLVRRIEPLPANPFLLTPFLLRMIHIIGFLIALLIGFLGCGTQTA